MTGSSSTSPCKHSPRRSRRHVAGLDINGFTTPVGPAIQQPIPSCPQSRPPCLQVGSPSIIYYRLNLDQAGTQSQTTTMLRTGSHRLCLTCLNIFFPPLAVMMMTGAGTDTLISCALFLLAVIPSHVHGFYISCVYFSRRRKVRKGRYPGRPHGFIHSEKVNNGGASRAEVEALYRAEQKSQIPSRQGMKQFQRTDSSAGYARGWATNVAGTSNQNHHRNERTYGGVAGYETVEAQEQPPALPPPSALRPTPSRQNSAASGGRRRSGSGVARQQYGEAYNAGSAPLRTRAINTVRP